MTRDFTVAVFAVSEGCVLMHFHSKLQMWLPPGGHIEPNELPDEAALREVMEETGVMVDLIGVKGLPVEYPRQLVIPRGVQVEDISPGHQHIDMVYFARPRVPLSPIPKALESRDQVGWYDQSALSCLPLTDEIRTWCNRAISEIQ